MSGERKWDALDPLRIEMCQANIGHCRVKSTKDIRKWGRIFLKVKVDLLQS